MKTKTFALQLRGPIRIGGVEYSAEEQVGAITCVGDLNPHDLLGLVQHHHAQLVEIADLSMDDDDDSHIPDDDATEASTLVDEIDDDNELIGDDADDDQDSDDDEKTELDPVNDPTDPVTDGEIDAIVNQEGGNAEADENKPSPTITAQQSMALFLADGLDEKIAKALVEGNAILTPDALREYIAADFDLVDLVDIGKARAEKILAIYKK